MINTVMADPKPGDVDNYEMDKFGFMNEKCSIVVVYSIP